MNPMNQARAIQADTANHAVTAALATNKVIRND